MGIFLSKLKLNPKKDFRILMLGLDGAGKTTILYKFKYDSVERTIPTIGFNVEQINYKNINFTVWDIGGQDKLRPLWKHYYSGVNAVIFVIDSNDKDRYHEMMDEILMLYNEDELKNLPFLFYANKCDMPYKIGFSKIYNDLNNIIKHKKFHLIYSNSLTGEGLNEGLDWLNKTLSSKY